MADTLFFVHDDAAAAEKLAEEFAGRGWEVASAAADDSGALERIAAARPVAAVFSLEGSTASAGRSLAEKVLADPRLLRPLMVFVGGSADEVGQARAAMPYGVFVSHDELPWVLKRLAVKS